MSYYDYVKGYTNQRISTYRSASQVLTRYTHYQLNFPNRDIMPVKAGNYLLKVFINGDSSKLAFTRRFMVVNLSATVAAQIQQPFNQQFFRTHQKIQFTINSSNLNVSYPNNK